MFKSIIQRFGLSVSLRMITRTHTKLRPLQFKQLYPKLDCKRRMSVINKKISEDRAIGLYAQASHSNN